MYTQCTYELVARSCLGTSSCVCVQAHMLEERLKQVQVQEQSQQQQQQPMQCSTSSGNGDGTATRQSAGSTPAGVRTGSGGPSSALAPWPAASRNPYDECEPPLPAQVNSYTCQKSFKVSNSWDKENLTVLQPFLPCG